MLNALSHVGSDVRKMCFFLLTCWMCWVMLDQMFEKVLLSAEILNMLNMSNYFALPLLAQNFFSHSPPLFLGIDALSRSCRGSVLGRISDEFRSLLLGRTIHGPRPVSGETLDELSAPLVHMDFLLENKAQSDWSIQISPEIHMDQWFPNLSETFCPDRHRSIECLSFFDWNRPRNWTRIDFKSTPCKVFSGGVLLKRGVCGWNRSVASKGRAMSSRLQREQFVVWPSSP